MARRLQGNTREFAGRESVPSPREMPILGTSFSGVSIVKTFPLLVEKRVRYHAYNSPKLGLFLSLMIPVNTLNPYFFKVMFSFILQTAPWSVKWFLTGIKTKNLHSFIISLISRVFHSFSFDDLNNW
jgi:hypothetical protein